MKHLQILAVVAACSLGAEIPAGTQVPVRSEQSASSRTSKPGDRLFLRTTAPLSDGSRVVIPAGTYIEAEIVKARQSGRVRGKAELQIHARTLVLPSGAARNLAGTIEPLPRPRRDPKQLRDPTSREIWAGLLIGVAAAWSQEYGVHPEFVIVGGSGAALAASVILKRGEEIEVRAGTTLNLRFEQAVALD